MRESRCACPWIPRLHAVPGECSRGVQLPAQQHERLHGGQQRRRRSLVSQLPCHVCMHHAFFLSLPRGLRTAAVLQASAVFFCLFTQGHALITYRLTRSSRSCVPPGMSPSLSLVFMGWAASVHKSSCLHSFYLIYFLQSYIYDRFLCTSIIKILFCMCYLKFQDVHFLFRNISHIQIVPRSHKTNLIAIFFLNIRIK